METEVAGIILGAVLPLYPMLFVIYQKIGRYDEIVEEFKKPGPNTMPTGRIFMETKIISPAVAQVIGIFRGKDGGFEPLGRDTPLTADEVCRNPVFYILDLNSDTCSENLIIDVIYDNLSPLRLQDLRRGTDIPHGVRFWPDWFDIPPYEEMHDMDGRLVYPRAPGLHTVQIRTGRRKFAQMGRVRDFSPENGGYTSPVFELWIGGKYGV